jgi:hypothetical protein
MRNLLRAIVKNTRIDAKDVKVYLDESDIGTRIEYSDTRLKEVEEKILL